jgi:hypothetical protein
MQRLQHGNDVGLDKIWTQTFCNGRVYRSRCRISSHYTWSRFCNYSSCHFIGIFASIVSNLVVSKFPKGKIDDALDVFACHGVGGMVGMLLTGVFASKSVNSVVGDNQGLIFGDTIYF